LEILKGVLTEYDVCPHMRLANVVRGRIKSTLRMSQYEIDFTILKKSGEVVCVIELDDPTHDTENGRRRDANKNKWLRQAQIPIIRIRQPDEAENIKGMIENASTPDSYSPIPVDKNAYVRRPQYSEFEILPIADDLPTWRPTHKSRSRKSANSKPYKPPQAVISVIGTIFMAIAAYTFLHEFPTHQQQTIQRMARQNAQARQQVIIKQQQQLAYKRQQEQDQLMAKQYQEAHQPHYERVFVKGKSAKECGHDNGGILDNSTVNCMNDHYEMVLVNGNQ
jgi:very-short-patch-repair endonuclease